MIWLERLGLNFVSLMLGIAIGLTVDYKVPPGQRWGYSGAIIGAGVTVLGALVLVGWTQRSDEKRRRRLMQDVLDGLSKAVNDPVFQGGATGPHSHTIIDSRINRLDNLIVGAKAARQWAPPSDARMVEAYMIIEKLELDYISLKRAALLIADDPEQEPAFYKVCLLFETELSKARRLLR